MAYCHITHDPKLGSYDIKFEHIKRPNNWDDIMACKNVFLTMIPSSHRAYDPSTKIWTLLITEQFLNDIIKPVIKNQHFQIKETTIKSLNPEDFFYNPAPEPQIETKESLAFKLETLLTINVSTTPFEELKRAYRRKALELHPDRNNGDGSKMSELNSIWTAFNAK